MKAVVFRAVGDIRLEDVPDPVIQEPTDAIVRLTASALCGTDLHLVRGTMPGMVPGTILGHEGVGVIEAVGKDVRNLNAGDRVVICSTIACGYCSYCRAGYYSKCDNANPNGKRAGTAFFGGPKNSGPFNGMQAEKVRVPYANVGCVKLPDGVNDDQAILLSDIFPTGFFGADNAEIKPGNTVAVFGCGPVGLFAIISAKMKDAGRIIAVDQIPSRLEMARMLGAETVNFNHEDPVETILRLTGGIGADRVIDAVGIDACRPKSGPAAKKSEKIASEFEAEIAAIAPKAKKTGRSWLPGDAPSQALLWEVEAIDKAGTLSIIGVYPETMRAFPIGKAIDKNLTMKMGDCPHRRYVPILLEAVENGTVDPSRVLTQIEPLSSVLDVYRAFDEYQAGWIKVELQPEKVRVEI